MSKKKLKNRILSTSLALCFTASALPLSSSALVNAAQVEDNSVVASGTDHTLSAGNNYDISKELIMPGESFKIEPLYDVFHTVGYYGQDVTNCWLYNASLELGDVRTISKLVRNTADVSGIMNNGIEDTYNVIKMAYERGDLDGVLEQYEECEDPELREQLKQALRETLKGEKTVTVGYVNNTSTPIVLHQRKYDKIQNIKKSMLEKMFPKNGSNVPEIRFKGFTDAWEQRKFSELVETRRGLTYKPTDIREKGVRVLRSSNIDEDRFVEKDDDVFVDENAINIGFAKEKDILITAENGSSRLVGKHAIVSNIPYKSTVHGGFMLLGTSEEPYFANASMSSSWYKRFIDLYVSGGNGAIGNLNKSDLDEQEILVPQKKEQQAIGHFFANLDNLITLHQRELEKLQNIKKSMLEKMFV